MSNIEIDTCKNNLSHLTKYNFAILKKFYLSISCLVLTLGLYLNTPSALAGQNIKIPSVKHRIAILPDSSRYWVNYDAPDYLRHHISLSENPPSESSLEKEWNSSQNIILDHVSKSRNMRATYLTPGEFSNPSSDTELDSVLLYNLTLNKNSFTSRFKIIDMSDKTIRLTKEGSSHSLADSIDIALKEVERYFSTRPWICQVAQILDGKIIVNRGYSDGLEVGTELIGVNTNSSNAALNLLLISEAFESKNTPNLYGIVSTSDTTAVVKPLNGAPMLKTGASLGVPAIYVSRPNENRSMDSRSWDAIYNN